MASPLLLVLRVSLFCRIRPNVQRRALWVAVLLEILFLMGWALLPGGRRAERAFLAKQDNRYILAWRDDAGSIEVIQMDSLSKIVKFSSEKLNLMLGKNWDPNASLESVWVSNRRGAYIVLWKNERDALLNQMSFFSQAEADFFATAFRKGAYSRSILGHSVILVER